jgi:hypothetical protein
LLPHAIPSTAHVLSILACFSKKKSNLSPLTLPPSFHSPPPTPCSVLPALRSKLCSLCFQVYNEMIYDLLAAPTGRPGAGAGASGGAGLEIKVCAPPPHPPPPPSLHLPPLPVLPHRHCCLPSSLPLTPPHPWYLGQEDKVRGIYVKGLNEVVVRDTAGLDSLMAQGNGMRTQAATEMNERSSRSHSIFTISLRQRDTADKGHNLFAKVCG